KGQQPVSSSPPTGQTSERLLTVHEPGKPAQQCRVLTSWPLAGGGTAYKVQSLATGEVTTIVQGSGGPAAGGPAPPGGVRQAGGQSISITVEGEKPETAKASPVPAGKPANQPAPNTAASGGDCCEYRTIQEPGRPPLRCRL